MKERTITEAARYALQSSCVPLLCGREQQVYRTARRLYRTYGIRSYGILLGATDGLFFFLRKLRNVPYLTVLPTTVTSPALLTETAVRFFDSLMPNAVPVLVDCTEAKQFHTVESDVTLEAHCFLCTPENIDSAPPFSYCFSEHREEKP